VRGEWLAWNKEKQQKAAAGQAKPNANAGSSCCLTKKARSGFAIDGARHHKRLPTRIWILCWPGGEKSRGLVYLWFARAWKRLEGPFSGLLGLGMFTSKRQDVRLLRCWPSLCLGLGKVPGAGRARLKTLVDGSCSSSCTCTCLWSWFSG